MGLVSLCDVAVFRLIIPMLEVDDKKDLSRSTNDVDDGDNLPAFWLNNVKESGIFYKINECQTPLYVYTLLFYNNY